MTAPVTFHLTGGVGNQLFQYAAGRAAALKLGVPLRLHTGEYGVNPLRQYRLEAFTIVIDRGSAAQRLAASLRQPLIRRGLIARPETVPTAVERQDVFDPTFFGLAPGGYARGYWQNEAYFSGIVAPLREELTFRHAPALAAAQMLEKIGAGLCVSVHVRRGDYISSAYSRTIYAPCPLAYYHRAAALVTERLGQAPRFFVFSDEPSWARENLRLPGDVTFVDLHSHLNPEEDLRLMAACHHHIIANSTFSWWGAWLNPRAAKIVVAPKTWYVGGGLSNAHINAASFMLVDNLQSPSA